MNLLDGNRRLSSGGVFYKPGEEKGIYFYVDDNFVGGWSQADEDNAENFMLCTGYVITYVG